MSKYKTSFVETCPVGLFSYEMRDSYCAKCRYKRDCCFNSHNDVMCEEEEGEYISPHTFHSLGVDYNSIKLDRVR